MGSPPQGYASSTLVVGNLAIRNDGSGNLGVFNGSTEIAVWATTGTYSILNGNNFAMRSGDPTSAIEFDYLQTAGIGKFRSVSSLGYGLAPIYGLDNRSGLTSADGAPINLYTLPVGTSHLIRISADIFATAVSAGTANYTVTWTENGQAKTMVVSASVINTLATATDLINPDSTSIITAQLTFAGFTGTVKVASLIEQLA